MRDLKWKSSSAWAAVLDTIPGSEEKCARIEAVPLPYTDAALFGELNTWSVDDEGGARCGNAISI